MACSDEGRGLVVMCAVVYSGGEAESGEVLEGDHRSSTQQVIPSRTGGPWSGTYCFKLESHLQSYISVKTPHSYSVTNVPDFHRWYNLLVGMRSSILAGNAVLVL